MHSKINRDQIKMYLGSKFGLYLTKSDAGILMFRDLDQQISQHPADSYQIIRSFLISRFSKGRNPLGLPKEYIEDISRLIASQRSETLETDLYEHLLLITKQLSPHFLDYQSWLRLEFIATASGLYRIGYELRNLSQKNLAGIEVDSKKVVLQQYRSAVDDSNFDLAHSKLVRIKNKSRSTLQSDLIDIYNSIIFNDRELAISKSKKLYSDVDQKFARILEGKRVAVVGPAPNDELSASEIDSFDVVIRLNYRGANSVPPPEQFGKKLDISYYNGDNAKSMLQANKFDFLDDLKFAIFKSTQYANHPLIKRPDKTRRLFSPNQFWFYGTPQMIQNVLFDLLHFNVAEIKLLKANFFLSQTPYYQGYSTVNYKRHDFKKVWFNHAKHNLISQLNFTRTLYTNGSIKVDSTCARVLDMPNCDYIKHIERIFVINPILLANQKEV